MKNMKRMVSVLLMLAVLAAIFTGCGEAEPVEEVTTAPAETGSAVPLQVSNVDELLSAIGPNREIILAEGTYHLWEASDYGMEPENPYYYWMECGDGFELKIRGVQNMFLRGSGKGSCQILTEPRYANVLTLMNCTNVVLQDFTAGHTQGGECMGGVLSIQGCMNVSAEGLGLFGCGTTGIRTELCTNVRVSGCDIYECSFTGIHASQVDGLTVKNSKLRELGNIQYGGGQVFFLDQCSNVTVSDCEITDNTVAWVVNYYMPKGMKLTDNTVARNRVEGCVFNIGGGWLEIDGNTFENNNIRSWFDRPDGTVIDGIGKTWTEEMLELEYNPPAEKQPAGDRTEVKVATVDELLAAIAPDTEIVLTEEFYDLSAAADYGTGHTDYYYWSEEFDGPNLVITDVNNLSIRSESGDVKKCTISAVPRYANVFTFRRCSNITLSGFTAGHTVEPGYCMGGVLDFKDCDTALVENCGLYGCGILGVQAEMCSDITVKDCDIYECSYGGIRMYDVKGVNIDGCTFRDLGGDSISLQSCREATVDGEAVDANYCSFDREYEY